MLLFCIRVSKKSSPPFVSDLLSKLHFNQSGRFSWLSATKSSSISILVKASNSSLVSNLGSSSLESSFSEFWKLHFNQSGISWTFSSELFSNLFESSTLNSGKTSDLISGSISELILIEVSFSFSSNKGSSEKLHFNQSGISWTFSSELFSDLIESSTLNSGKTSDLTSGSISGLISIGVSFSFSSNKGSSEKFHFNQSGISCLFSVITLFLFVVSKSKLKLSSFHKISSTLELFIFLLESWEVLSDIKSVNYLSLSLFLDL